MTAFDRNRRPHARDARTAWQRFGPRETLPAALVETRLVLLALSEVVDLPRPKLPRRDRPIWSYHDGLNGHGVKSRRCRGRSSSAIRVDVDQISGILADTMSRQNVERVRRIYVAPDPLPALAEHSAPDVEFDLTAVYPDQPVLRGIEEVRRFRETSSLGRIAALRTGALLRRR